MSWGLPRGALEVGGLRALLSSRLFAWGHGHPLLHSLAMLVLRPTFERVVCEPSGFCAPAHAHGRGSDLPLLFGRFLTLGREPSDDLSWPIRNGAGKRLPPTRIPDGKEKSDRKGKQFDSLSRRPNKSQKGGEIRFNNAGRQENLSVVTSIC